MKAKKSAIFFAFISQKSGKKWIYPFLAGNRFDACCLL
jgi:hypothetical protein